MKNIVFVIALVVLSAAGYGQKVNFSGDWKFNSELSELGDQFSLAPNSVVVKHTKKTLEMERNSTWDGQDFTTNDFFTLDGKECENPGMMDSIKKSTATYDKKTQKLTITSYVELEDGTEVEIIEEIKMEGENLVIESSVASSYGDMLEKFVFDKQ